MLHRAYLDVVHPCLCALCAVSAGLLQSVSCANVVCAFLLHIFHPCFSGLSRISYITTKSSYSRHADELATVPFLLLH